ncbi:MAG TPA: hypothetical protein ENJ82_12415 [Bacteroidetes bacterium]|nr:hypothetical protein [Bacteroidota bacterium]
MQKNIGPFLWNMRQTRINSMNTRRLRLQTMHAATQIQAHISISQHLRLLLLETQSLLLTFLQFIFLPSEQARKKYPVLLRNLFLLYLIPAFFFLGTQAIFLMVIYQFGFNMLLRAVLYK